MAPRAPQVTRTAQGLLLCTCPPPPPPAILGASCSEEAADQEEPDTAGCRDCPMFLSCDSPDSRAGCCGRCPSRARAGRRLCHARRVTREAALRCGCRSAWKYSGSFPILQKQKDGGGEGANSEPQEPALGPHRSPAPRQRVCLSLGRTDQASACVLHRCTTNHIPHLSRRTAGERSKWGAFQKPPLCTLRS